MRDSFISYMNISEKKVHEFENYWAMFSELLPPIQSNTQTEDNIKAGAFNVWLSYASENKFLFLKTDKFILHSYDHHLVERLESYLWKNEQLHNLYEGNKENSKFLFILSYLIRMEIFIELDDFVLQHPILKSIDLKLIRYYELSDIDIEKNDEIYIIMKILNAEFLQQYLNESKMKIISKKLYASLIEYKHLYS